MEKRKAYRNKFIKMITIFVVSGMMLLAPGLQILAAPEDKDTNQDFRFFKTDPVYAIAKRDKIPIYEEKDEGSELTGRLEVYGVLHILSEEEDDWYYVESGEVRGFILSKGLMTGKKAEKYVKQNKEECLETAVALMSPLENESFYYTRTTGYETIAEKVYASPTVDIEIMDRIPAKDENKSNEKSKAVGLLEEGALCFIIEDEEEEWVFIESGDVRGFVPFNTLIVEGIEEQVTEGGEESYLTAKEYIRPKENRACYYTYLSVKEAAADYEEEQEPENGNGGLSHIREAIISYAAQFIGNPYVWGGTILTQGADCSGFVQSIYGDFGYNIPRVAEDQAKFGTRIPVEQAQPGDLIFYERNNYIYHVVMCAGNGETIEAQSSATGIVNAGINWDVAAWAVRIISEEDENALADYSYQDEEVTYGKYLGKFKLTAYCACPKCCGVWSGGATASGLMPVEDRTVAMGGVDFGTKLIIGGQIYTVEDRGTPYGHVDIFMNNHQDAIMFGLQYTDVYLAE